MSNEYHNIEQDTKYMEILGSPEFIPLLTAHLLDVLEHNKLFAIHLLSVAARSSNIVKGNVELYYESGEYSFQAKRRIPKPVINFEFVTSKGNVIKNEINERFYEERIVHKNYDFTTPQEFQYFFIQQEKSIRSLSELELILFNDNDLSLIKEQTFNFNTTNIFHYKKKQSIIYHSLLEQNPQLQKFIQFHMMQEKYGMKDYVPSPKTQKRRKI